MSRASSRNDHSFLVLRENRLAFTAITQLVASNSPKGSPPPVTIYGPSGTGKSHLVRHAIRSFQEHFPQAQSLIVSAGQFAEELAEASAAKTLPAFVKKYRVPAGLFVCEDLQAISGRRETQEQLISLWNHLVARQTRILVTADRAPGELRDFHPRLVNRMQGGVCIGTSRLSEASREKLIRHFAQSTQLPLTDQQLRRLATASSFNAHELWGLMSTIQLRLKSRPQQGLEKTVESVLGDQPQLQGPSLHEIAKAVATVFGAKLPDLRSDARDRRLATPRQIAMHVMRDLGKAQLGEIGEFFGGRTHSTVLHGCRRIAQLLQSDQTLRLQYDQVCQKLRRGRPVRTSKTC